MGSEVRTPCPISDLPHQIFAPPSEESSSQAFGEKEFASEAPIALSGRILPDRWNGRNRAAPGAGLGGASRARRGACGSTPRQPTGRPLTASFTERKSTTYINWR